MTVVDQMEKRIFSVNKPEYAPLHTKRTLLYSRPGGGKSTLIAGIEGIAIIDTEGSHAAFEVLRADARSWPESVEAVSFMAANAPGKVKIVGVDSISNLYAQCRRYVLDREGWSTEKDGGGFGAGYEVVRAEFRPVLNMLFDLHDIHGIGLMFVTHESERFVENEQTGDYYAYEPQLPDNGERENQIGPTIMRVFENIWRYSIEGVDEPQHVLTTQGTAAIEAKDRTARMPARLVIPNMTMPSPTDRAKAAWSVIENAYKGSN